MNGGLINTVLGSAVSLSNVNFGRSLYLEMIVDADGDDQITLADPPLLPRQSSLSAAFAVESEISQTVRDRAITTDKLGDGSVTAQKVAAGAIEARSIADGSIGKEKLTPELVQSAVVPPGTVVAFAGQQPPPGWKLCNGDPVSRQEFPALFAAIGTLYGPGDGSTTFNLPDYRGRFLRGTDGRSGRDTDPRSPMLPGATAHEVGTIQEEATRLPQKGWDVSTEPDHHHSYRHHTGRVQVYGSANIMGGPVLASGPIAKDKLGDDTTGNAGHHSHKISGGDKETRPLNISVNYLIKD